MVWPLLLVVVGLLDGRERHAAAVSKHKDPAPRRVPFEPF